MWRELHLEGLDTFSYGTRSGRIGLVCCTAGSDTLRRARPLLSYRSTRITFATICLYICLR